MLLLFNIIQKFTYEGKFEGDILVVGGLTVAKPQKLAVNNSFRKLEKAEWVSQTRSPKQREAQIQLCYSCHYPKNTEELDHLLEELKKDRESMVDITDFTVEKKIFFGKEQKLDQLFVIDNGSGLADQSNAFARFWAVSRKFKYSFVYIFHIIYPEK